jgi:hypothetical protein
LGKKKSSGYTSVTAATGAKKSGASKSGYKAPKPNVSYSQSGGTGPKKTISYKGKPVSSGKGIKYAPTPSAVASKGVKGAVRAATPKRVIRQRVEKRQARKQLIKAVGKTGGLAKKLDRPFKIDGGETITPREAAIVTESVGLPGKTYAKGIIPGESGFQPGITNPDDNTPSLYQITPSVQSAETQAKFDQIAKKHKGGYTNPIAAAKQAKYLAQGGTGVSNYVAYDGSPIEHLPGGQKAAKKKLYGSQKKVPKPVLKRAKKVLGKKETQKTVKAAREGEIDKSGAPVRGKPAKPKKKGGGKLETAELFHDPGVNIVDGQPTGAIGNHGTHVHFASDNPRDVIAAGKLAKKMGLSVSENPYFEGSHAEAGVHTEGSEHYQESELPRKIIKKKGPGAMEGLIGDAIDVSGGDAAALLKYNKALAKRSGVPSGDSGGSLGAVGTTTGGTAAGVAPTTGGTTTAPAATATTTTKKRKAKRTKAAQEFERKKAGILALMRDDLDIADPLSGFTSSVTSYRAS